MTDKTVVLAFSGGLDTSFCVVHLREQGYKVVTVTVDTGGFDGDTLGGIDARAESLGSSRHITADANQRVYDDHIAYLIKGNVLRGAAYPLCVGAERVVQARVVAEIARELAATGENVCIAHGSTAAGNDQIRFDVAIRSLCPDMEILTPIRDEHWTRTACTDFLRARGVEVSNETKDYSINEGLWGVTIGGRETHDSWEMIPESAWVWTATPGDAPPQGQTIELTFANGLPVALDGEALGGVELVRRLNKTAGAHGVGRGMHLGDTILGIKGRVAFEAPAAQVLIAAHRELEKLVLTRMQQNTKEHLAAQWGQMLHEANYFDPVARDIEAFIDSSQRTVNGEARVHLRQGAAQVLGVRSPYSLMQAAAGTYGEENKMWKAADARGFATIYGTQSILAARSRAANEA